MPGSFTARATITSTLWFHQVLYACCVLTSSSRWVMEKEAICVARKKSIQCSEHSNLPGQILVPQQTTRSVEPIRATWSEKMTRGHQQTKTPLRSKKRNCHGPCPQRFCPACYTTKPSLRQGQAIPLLLSKLPTRESASQRTSESILQIRTFLSQSFSWTLDLLAVDLPSPIVLSTMTMSWRKGNPGEGEGDFVIF